jgi:carbon-monoxide dehydrogenase medium subunit
VVPAAEFFVTQLTTALQPGEVLAEVRFPAGAGPGWGFQEFSRRPGDYALAAAAVVLRVGPDGAIAGARIALAAVADRPVRAVEAERALLGARGEPARLAEAAGAAAAPLTPPADVHGSGEYRRHLARVLVERALADAWRRLGG